MVTERKTHDTPFPLPVSVVRGVWRAALDKGLVRVGDTKSFTAALSRLGEGLVSPEAVAAVVGLIDDAGSPSGKTSHALDWRSLGDAFWSQGGRLEERKNAGSFYTPERVIDRILGLLWDDIYPGVLDDSRATPVLDPALGCGYFFLRLADRLEAAGVGVKRLREWVGTFCYGVDREAGAVFMTRILLWLRLSGGDAAFFPSPGNLLQGDSLSGPAFDQDGTGETDWNRSFRRVKDSGGFGVVLGNPPYEVLTNFTRRPEARAFAARLRGSGWYPDSQSGQINLYRCFIERSLDLLRPGGALSFVTPFSFARDSSAAALRQRLLKKEATAEWIFYDEDEALFTGVTQSACVFLARRGAGKARQVRVTSSRGEVKLGTEEIDRFFGGVIPEADENDVALWRWVAAKYRVRIKDVAEMRVGEVDQTVYRDCMQDADTGCILARGVHMHPFWLDVQPHPGRERFLDLPRFLEKKGGTAEACRDRASRWRVAQLGIRNMRTLPRLVAALAPPGTYLGNSLNVYIPQDGVSPAFLCAVLNSRFLDWMFRLTSGNNNINLREIADLPFPGELDAAAIGRVETLYAACADQAAGGKGVEPELRSRLDQVIETSYGLPTELMAQIAFFRCNHSS